MKMSNRTNIHIVKLAKCTILSWSTLKHYYKGGNVRVTPRCLWRHRLRQVGPYELQWVHASCWKPLSMLLLCQRRYGQPPEHTWQTIHRRPAIIQVIFIIRQISWYSDLVKYRMKLLTNYKLSNFSLVWLRSLNLLNPNCLKRFVNSEVLRISFFLNF